MINVNQKDNPYYAAYAALTPEDERENVDYIGWIRSKWDSWKKETKHVGGLNDKDFEAFRVWLEKNLEGV